MAEAAWGMSETHTCDTFTSGFQDDDLDLRGQPVFVGLPVPGTQIKICDFETGELKPLLGEEGEIVVRTPSLLKSYWNKPGASADSLRDDPCAGLSEHDLMQWCKQNMATYTVRCRRISGQRAHCRDHQSPVLWRGWRRHDEPPRLCATLCMAFGRLGIATRRGRPGSGLSQRAGSQRQSPGSARRHPRPPGGGPIAIPHG